MCVPLGTGFPEANPVSPKPCFNRQIGLCPGVCTGEISRQEYGKVIRSITLFFKGRKQEILRSLRKHMKQEAKSRNFEKAAELRNKIFALEHINDIALLKRDRLTVSSVADSQPRGFRIEGYDVAHISGTHAVGVMVVMQDGMLAKDEYRKFKLRVSKNDDVGSLAELLIRRFGHKEWLLPDLIVVDGGVAQLNSARDILKFRNLDISIVSVVKNEKHKPDHIMGDSKVVRDYHRDILRVNQEAHRFAINYHKLLRDKIRS